MILFYELLALYPFSLAGLARRKGASKTGKAEAKRGFLTTCPHLYPPTSTNPPPRTTLLSYTKTMEDSDGLPIFAFQDLDYIPSGFGGILAPYIETTGGTMRAAATLMGLGLVADDGVKGSGVRATSQQVVCDLGCGDGYFRRHLLHITVRAPFLRLSDSPSVLGDQTNSPEKDQGERI